MLSWATLRLEGIVGVKEKFLHKCTSVMQPLEYVGSSGYMILEMTKQRGCLLPNFVNLNAMMRSSLEAGGLWPVARVEMVRGMLEVD